MSAWNCQSSGANVFCGDMAPCEPSRNSMKMRVLLDTLTGFIAEA